MMMVGQNGQDLDSSFRSYYDIIAAYLICYTERSPLLTGRTLLIATFVRNNFKLKESTLLLAAFFQTDEVSKVSECNVQVPEETRHGFCSLAT